MENYEQIVRFRADPAKVRVAVRSHSGCWTVTVSPKEQRDLVFVGRSRWPLLALMRALRAADGILSGVDLGMGWAYNHPFGVEGAKARVPEREKPESPLKMLTGLFAWRDAATDRWGEDLAFLLMYEFSKRGCSEETVPELYRKTLRAFRALDEKEQWQRIEAYVNA